MTCPDCESMRAELASLRAQVAARSKRGHPSRSPSSDAIDTLLRQFGSDRAAAKHLGVDATTFRRWRVAFGIPALPQTHMGGRPRHHSDGEIVSALGAANSIKGAARALGYSHWSLQQRGKRSPVVREAIDRLKARQEARYSGGEP